jgi:hypothetical protein
MSKWLGRGGAVLGLIGVLGACSSERQGSSGQDAGPDGGLDAGLVRDAGQGGQLVAVEPIGSSIMPVPDAGDLGSFATPTNVSFATALALEVGSEHAQRVFTGLQVDYYRFEAQAGTFYELRTNRSEASPNNVISVFDAGHHLVAENDSGSLWPGDFVDARLLLRFAEAGTYYVRVEDRTTPDDYFRDPFALPFSYRVRVREVNGDTPGFAMAGTDGADGELRFERDDTSGNAYVTLLGVLDGPDAVRVSLSGQTGRALIGQLTAAGIGGDGSSARGVHVSVREQDGRTVAAIAQEREQASFHPPLAAGRYELQVQAGAERGDNDFYAIDLVLLDDNPSERNERANGKPDSAEALQWRGSVRRRALVLARLPAQDVDFFRVDADSGERVAVACEGESGGSGVRGLHVSVLDDRQQVLAQADEPSASNLHLEGVDVPGKGAYYVRLSSSTSSEESAEADPWVRCAVIVAPTP